MCVGEKYKRGTGKIDNFSTQHRGTGKTLLKKAEHITWINGYKGTAVITGEGVRSYYHKRGYVDNDTFVVKEWTITLREIVWGMVFFTGLLAGYIMLNA